jgi:protein TonB
MSAMVQSASIGGGPLIYRGVETLQTSDRATAIAVVLALHAVVVGVLVVAQLRAPPPPPETTLSVSFITETAAAPALTPPPPQTPTPPRPEPRLMATATPTPSPMSAPPIERETQLQPPAPPAPAAPPSTPSANAAPAAAVTPPNFNAAYLNNPGPVYPMGSRRKREQGTVRLRVHVNPDGAPDQVLLDRTSGHSDLDAAALDVVKKRWRFAPAKQGDRTVAAWVIVPLEFSLDR